MKKQLLASTMLVAAGALTATGAAEAKIDVTVNGYFEAILGSTFADNEDVFQVGGQGNIGKRALADVQTESEIHFNARTELDNGIKIQVHMELEGSAGATAADFAAGRGDLWDEQYVIVRGNFGQLTIGSEDNAGHLMTIGYLGSWATNVGQNLTFDVGDFITRPYGAKFDGTLNDPRLRSTDNDSDKITYFTPRFAGLQLGASYIPNNSQDQNGSQASTESSYNNGVALGVNFQRKFDQVGIGVAAGYLHMMAPAGAAPGSIFDNDARAFTVAARVDFGPVRVAGGVKRNINIMEGTTGTTSLDGTIFDVGTRLTMGPNRFSLTYANGRMKGDLTTPNDRREQAAMLSYARTLGPGVSWSLNTIWGSFSGDQPGPILSAAGSQSQRSAGVALSTSLRLNF